MQITNEQREHIRTSILDKYRKVAAGEPGQFRYPTGEEGLAGLGYEPGWISHLPQRVRECFCGVGNPFAMGLPEPGMKVLDVGSGCGVDTLVSAGFAGPGGMAVGVEMSPEMLGKARGNAHESEAGNAYFVQATADVLPFADGTFDMVTSSGVYNLVVDKRAALAEAFRVLKPGGRLQVADQILTGPPPMSASDMVASWFT